MRIVSFPQMKGSTILSTKNLVQKRAEKPGYIAGCRHCFPWPANARLAVFDQQHSVTELLFKPSFLNLFFQPS